MKFQLGRLVATRAVADLMAKDTAFAKFVSDSLERYTNGDWGELSASDQKQNDDALKNSDNRIFASYHFPKGYNGFPTETKIWIITEWDRSVTTVLFPSDY